MPYPIETTAQLIACDLEPDMENSIWFASASDRDSFFQSKVIRTETNIQYVRESQNWRVNAPYDDIIGSCNYLRYRNKADGRWFYGFVTNIQYLNPNVCSCNFTLDAWMTYQFDLTWEDCFIERECVSDDSVGANIVDEGLGTGVQLSLNVPEFNNSPAIDSGKNSLKLCPVIFLSEAYLFANSEDTNPSTMGVSSFFYGVPQPCSIWCPCDNSGGYNTLPPTPVEMASQLDAFMRLLANAGKAEAVISCVALPRYNLELYFNSSGESLVLGGNDTSAGCYITNMNTASPYIAQWSVNIPLSFNSYTPINNKLYTYPYYYYTLTNGNGDECPILVEYMEKQPNADANVLNIAYCTPLSPDAKMIVYPTNYMKANRYDFSVTVSGLPQLALTSNAYANWLGGNRERLVANAVNTTASGIIDAIGNSISLAAGNPSGGAGLLSGAASSFGHMGELFALVQDKQKMPNSVHSHQSGNDCAAADRLNVYLIQHQLNPQLAKIIDNFFSMFGYKVNRLGTPQFHTRQYWNYYKIPVCNVHADIPGESMDQIKTMFNRGVTLWADGNSIGNYHGGSNPIL